MEPKRKAKESLDKILQSSTIIGDNQIELEVPTERVTGGQEQKHNFFFDNVFGPSKKQADIYQEVQHLIQSYIDGHDVCIFSYGQTGSGKTYTMGTDSFSLASEETQGIIPRGIN